MSELIVETLPANVYDEVTKVGLVRKDLQDGLFDRVETPTQDMIMAHDIENDQNLVNASDENRPVRNSANLEALYNIIQVVDADMRFAMNPNYNGKIRHDNMIDTKLAKYYKISIKKYARQIKILIDGLIKYDGFHAERFDDYARCVKVIANTDSEIADEFLLKLVTICKQLIPPDMHIQNSFVIDSNSVDINKVSE